MTRRAKVKVKRKPMLTWALKSDGKIVFVHPPWRKKSDCLFSPGERIVRVEIKGIVKK